MKRFLALLATGAVAIGLSSTAQAQVRAISGGALILDDNAGHTLTIQTPQPGDPGYAAWIAGGALIWKIPIPPVPGANAGFVLPGTAAGQSVYWDMPAPGGTGGPQGTWRPTAGSGLTILGAGTTNTIPKFTAGTTVGNSQISDAGGATGITFSSYGLGILRSSGVGVLSSGPLVSADIPNNAANTSGNAGTATALQIGRTINGVTFDGTTNITVTAAAGTLTGATLANNVLSSSLTSVGTLTNLTVTNPISGSITGNAATVTTDANLTGPVTSVGNATAIAANALTESMVNNLTTDLASKATDALVVHLAGTESITGAKTFTQTITGNISGNAATVTTDANLTGPVTSVGNATAIAANALTESMVNNLTSDLASKATDALVVHLAGTESITGAKTFTQTITGNISGNAGGTATNVTGVVVIANGGTNSSSPLANGKVMISNGGAIVEGPVWNTGTGTLSGNINGNAATVTTDANLTGPVTSIGNATAIAANALSESMVNNLTSDLASKAADALVVHLAGAESITGAKTFTQTITGNITGNAGGTAANVTGVVAIANGGTNSSSALANGKLMASVGGQIVEGTSSSAPSFTTETLTGTGSTLNMTNAAPSIQIPAASTLTWQNSTPATLATLQDVAGTGKFSTTGDIVAAGQIRSNTVGGAAIYAPSGGITTGSNTLLGTMTFGDGTNAFTGTLETAPLTASRTYLLPDKTGTFFATTSQQVYTDVVLLQPGAIQQFANGTADGIALQEGVGATGGFMVFYDQFVNPLFTVGNTGSLITSDYINVSNTTNTSKIQGAAAGTALQVNSGGGAGSLGLGVGTSGSPETGVVVQSTLQDMVLTGLTQSTALVFQGGGTLGEDINTSGGGYSSGIHAVGNGATTTTFGAKFEGNGAVTDAGTNSGLVVLSGEINVGRQATAAADNGGGNIITENDATPADLGPSGVVDLGSIAAPGANAVTNGSLVVHNLYAKSTSIVILTILNGEGANILHESVAAQVESRGTGQFTIRVVRLADATGAAGGWTPRVGFLVINANK